MNLSTLTLARAPGWLRATLLLALLGGCGGGVDSGGTGGATVYASGPINGYGSVIVNGVRFDDSAPSVDIRDDDGTRRTKDDLKLGMVVEIRSSSITTDTYGDFNSTASSIVIGSEIVGPIDAPPGTTSFAVLGRNIDVQPTTVFASSNSEGLVGGLSALVQGDIVEVYGLYNAIADRFTATRIERKSLSSPPEHYRVRGPVVSGLNVPPSTFSIGTLLIDYALVPSTERPPFRDGTILRVRLNATAPAAGNPWIANRLRAGISSPDDGTESKLEGLIDSIAVGTPTPQFTVNGVSVTTNASTLINSSAARPLEVGARVEVEGRFSNGALAATEVEVEDSAGDDFDFRGPIQSLPQGTTTLRINNVDIDYSNVTDWKGSGTGPEALAPGRNVRVRANLVNSITYQAYEIEFRN
jgi:Domain of unknown function (DUF5666)